MSDYAIWYVRGRKRILHYTKAETQGEALAKFLEEKGNQDWSRWFACGYRLVKITITMNPEPAEALT